MYVRRGNTSRIVLGVIGAGVILCVAFAWICAPLRAKALAAKYETFRAAFQAEHDAIDAAFNHQDRVVNGIQWHYVDEGDATDDWVARDGLVIVSKNAVIRDGTVV